MAEVHLFWGPALTCRFRFCRFCWSGRASVLAYRSCRSREREDPVINRWPSRQRRRMDDMKPPSKQNDLGSKWLQCLRVQSRTIEIEMRLKLSFLRRSDLLLQAQGAEIAQDLLHPLEIPKLIYVDTDTISQLFVLCERFPDGTKWGESMTAKYFSHCKTVYDLQSSRRLMEGALAGLSDTSAQLSNIHRHSSTFIGSCGTNLRSWDRIRNIWKSRAKDTWDFDGLFTLMTPIPKQNHLDRLTATSEQSGCGYEDSAYQSKHVLSRIEAVTGVMSFDFWYLLMTHMLVAIFGPTEVGEPNLLQNGMAFPGVTTSQCWEPLLLHLRRLNVLHHQLSNPWKSKRLNLLNHLTHPGLMRLKHQNWVKF